MNRQSQRRGSRNLRKAPSSREFSKSLVLITGAIFILSLVDIRYLAYQCIDVSSYATQQILTTGGIFGASIIFYLNKSKMENLSKGRLRFTLLRLRLEIKLKDKLDPESYDLIMQEINNIDSMLDRKLDGALEEAVQKDIDIGNF